MAGAASKSKPIRRSLRPIYVVAKQWLVDLNDVFVVFPWKYARQLVRFTVMAPIQALHGLGVAINGARKLQLQQQLLLEEDQVSRKSSTRSGGSGTASTSVGSVGTSVGSTSVPAVASSQPATTATKARKKAVNGQSPQTPTMVEELAGEDKFFFDLGDDEEDVLRPLPVKEQDFVRPVSGKSDDATSDKATTRPRTGMGRRLARLSTGSISRLYWRTRCLKWIPPATRSPPSYSPPKSLCEAPRQSLSQGRRGRAPRGVASSTSH